MTPEEEAEFKRRRAARSRVMLALLLGFVALFYAITWARFH